MDDYDLKFRSDFEIENPPFKISHQDQILLAGSCFSDVVGQKLSERKFQTLINPFGNIYNPHSLFILLNKSLHLETEEDYSFVENDGKYFNYNFHSKISGNDKVSIVNNIKTIKEEVHHFLKNATVLILTFGTAYVYRLLENDKIVANCHKIPSFNFEKYLLSPKEILDDFDTFYRNIQSINPSVKILLTLSPVRHLKDSIPLNSVSKSIVRTAIHYICESYSSIYYFPSYEILMDDLRDYRFYKEDLIHPSNFSEQYIWKKFSNAFFDESSLSLITELEKIQKAIDHRPFNPESKSHQQFLNNYLKKAEQLGKSLNMNEEIQFFKSRMSISDR